MARLKVVGVSVKSGEYQGHAYKNLMLYTLTKDREVQGEMCETVKVKFKVVNEALQLNMTAAEVDNLGTMDFINLIGKEIAVHYDKFRNVEDIFVYPAEPKKTTWCNSPLGIL